MPWECRSVETIRKEFVAKAIMGEESISALCRQFGISRPTAYKWIERYRNGDNMSDKSHEPFFKPLKTSPEKEYLIVETRINHPTWGARKIQRYLADRGFTDLPAASTISDIIKRNGLVSVEETEKHTAWNRFEKENPNDLWQMDFKGHFGMLNNNRCHPLTVLDDCSRYSLCIDAKDNECWNGVKSSLERLFYENGKPYAILCDNGPSWGHCKQRHSAFDLWMMQLDILPMHGRPLHPQTQGKEERFHRTMKKDLLERTAIRDLVHAQEEFDLFRYCYNNERPHEALNLDVPAKHYKPSKRIYIDKINEPEYDSGRQLRKVNFKGYVSIRRKRYYLSEVFIGKYLEISEKDNNRISLNYGNFQIAEIDLDEQLVVSRKIFRR